METFDYSKQELTDDCCSSEMNDSASEESVKWEVFYNCGYWKPHGKGCAGEEIILDRHFNWGNEAWYIPAVYACNEGLVIDFCVGIKSKYLKDFMDKWKWPPISEEPISMEKREQLERENPLVIEFRPYLMLNHKEIHPKHSYEISWIPIDILPDGMENTIEATQLVKHYRLDTAQAWAFHRWSYPWDAKKKPIIKSLKLRLERNPTSIISMHFKNPVVGDVFHFVHPVSGVEHKLAIQAYDQQELPKSTKSLLQDNYIFPTQYVAMIYTLEPDLMDRNIQVQDCVENDQPKQKQEDPFEPKASSIGIISGADRPTSKNGQNRHGTMSALHFEQVADIEWRVVLQEKIMDDIEVSLI